MEAFPSILLDCHASNPEQRQRGLRLKHLILSAFLVSVASVSMAEEPLSGDAVARFAADWPAMAAELAKADLDFDPAMGIAVESQLQDMASSDSKDSRLDRVVAAHDYPDFESFAAFAARTLTAAKWAKDPPDATDLKAALEAVEADDEMTADAKTALSASIEEAYAKALTAKPSDADIDTVRPHLAAIEASLANR
jgi:hypothetical protein